MEKSVRAPPGSTDIDAAHVRHSSSRSVKKEKRAREESSEKKKSGGGKKRKKKSSGKKKDRESGKRKGSREEKHRRKSKASKDSKKRKRDESSSSSSSDDTSGASEGNDDDDDAREAKRHSARLSARGGADEAIRQQLGRGRPQGSSRPRDGSDLAPGKQSTVTLAPARDAHHTPAAPAAQGPAKPGPSAASTIGCATSSRRSVPIGPALPLDADTHRSADRFAPDDDDDTTTPMAAADLPAEYAVKVAVGLKQDVVEIAVTPRTHWGAAKQLACAAAGELDPDTHRLLFRGRGFMHIQTEGGSDFIHRRCTAVTSFTRYVLRH